MTGQVIWITGLSGAGKTTVAKQLTLRIREGGLQPILLDGDILRDLFKNTEASNVSAAKGGIEDADFALETTNLAKNQILQQASTAMLAQANAAKQNVLSLLQG